MAAEQPMTSAFYDTNLFLYAAMRALPVSDAPKKPIARALIERADFGLSAQVVKDVASFKRNLPPR